MIQIRLWDDCINNCSFCSLGHKSQTSIQDKIQRINTLLNIKDSKIGLIGGEFFEGQLKGCTKEWLNMISKLSCDELFITANLINSQYLLKETLEIRPDILICTSYDTKGRFHIEQQKEQWLLNVISLPKVFCTIIPTQDIINDSFIDRIPCGINICEPHLGLEWYRNVDKTNYHAHLIKDNKIFNLPKRKDLLTWLKKHPQIIQTAKLYKNNHFSSILKFDNTNSLIIEEKDRFNDNNFMAKCGHPHFGKCYADSDKCLMCDLEEL